ncbi:MAG: alpha/beta hydrolase [Candidatus Altiarchaeota archaeon]|nr:alpha/beta hydrolase [Candidatus Altiarchaeota archaeon]
MFHTTPDGLKIYYRRIKGKKPTLVFLHGLAEDHTTFKYVSKAFSDHSQLLIDLRGHGKSSKPHGRAYYLPERLLDDVKEIIHKEKLKNFNVIGFSLGGYLAIQIKGAKKVIAINPPFGRTSMKLYFKVLLWLSKFVPETILKLFEKQGDLFNYAGLIDAYITRRLNTPPYVDLNILDNLLALERTQICDHFILIKSTQDELVHDSPVGNFKQYRVKGHHNVIAENPNDIIAHLKQLL